MNKRMTLKDIATQLNFMMEKSIPEFNEYFTRIDIIIKSGYLRKFMQVYDTAA